jgi:general secretion pathway protein J
MTPQRPSEQGFTLIELMISLGLFALIAVAGLGMVDGILGVQARTEARLDRLSDLQRAMLVIDGDLDAVASGDLNGTADGLSFVRSAPGMGGPALPIRYTLGEGVLMRMAGPQPQMLLRGVAGIRFRYLGEGWSDRWPVEQEAMPPWPRAVEVVVTLAPGSGPQGSLRRLVVLPDRPPATETKQP